MARGPGEDLPVGADDHRVARLHPLGLVRVGPPHAVPVGEVGGDLVDPHARVDTDHVAATLAGDVAQVATQPSPSPGSAPPTCLHPASTGRSAPAACSSPSRSAHRGDRRESGRSRASSRRPCPTPCAPSRSASACGACPAACPRGRSTAWCCRSCSPSARVPRRRSPGRPPPRAPPRRAARWSHSGPRRPGRRASRTTARHRPRSVRVDPDRGAGHERLGEHDQVGRPNGWSASTFSTLASVAPRSIST